MEESGEIEVGFVVFITKPFRISAVNVIEGQTISSQMAAFTITGQSQEIISNLDPNDAEIVNALDRVEVELPDGRIVPGAVAEVARVATREINPPDRGTGRPNHRGDHRADRRRGVGPIRRRPGGPGPLPSR